MTLRVAGSPARPDAALLEAVIGLEVHLALRTSSKLFCGCAADTFADAPNSHVCPVCLGLPGSLPVANRAAVELATTFALALGCRVPATTQFYRKHYFYPDAPKNYQLSQLDRPIGEGGSLEVGGRAIRITRCHLEEDAGRLVHPPYADHSLVDFNRAGAPLIEMVTEPDIRSPEEARAFLETVRAVARSLAVSDAAPEQGKMRCDVNVSVHRPGTPLGTKVEIKNLNSFKSVQTSLEKEIRRQALLLEEGRPVVRETRGWNEGGQKTYVLRSKEESADYRYMVDPDLPRIPLGEELVDRLRATMPELPWERRARYASHGVRHAEALAMDVDEARTFDAMLAATEAIRAAGGVAPEAQAVATFLLSEVAGARNARTVAEGSGATGTTGDAIADPAALVQLLALVGTGRITMRVAKDLLPEVLDGADPHALVASRGLGRIDDHAALERLVDEALEAHPELVAGVREHPKALNALMGQVMRASGGKAKPDAVRALLEDRLGLH